MVGVITPLSQEQYQILENLRMNPIKVIKVIGGLSHEQWQSFSNEKYTRDAKNFIDGDLIESFLKLNKNQIEEIATAMGVLVDGTAVEIIMLICSISCLCCCVPSAPAILLLFPLITTLCGARTLFHTPHSSKSPSLALLYPFFHSNQATDTTVMTMIDIHGQLCPSTLDASYSFLPIVLDFPSVACLFWSNRAVYPDTLTTLHICTIPHFFCFNYFPHGMPLPSQSSLPLPIVCHGIIAVKRSAIVVKRCDRSNI